MKNSSNFLKLLQGYLAISQYSVVSMNKNYGGAKGQHIVRLEGFHRKITQCFIIISCEINLFIYTKILYVMDYPQLYIPLLLWDKQAVVLCISTS